MAYSYARVENALATVLGIPTGARGAFRGRLKHLQKLGLSEGKPGKGARIEYGDDTVVRWLLALRFENIGLNPVSVVDFITTNWERKSGREFPKMPLKDVVEKARRAKDTEDVWLTVTLDFLPGVKKRGDFPRIGYTQPYLKPHPKYEGAPGFFNFSKEYAVDRVAIPLTEILRKLETELSTPPVRKS